MNATFGTVSNATSAPSAATEQIAQTVMYPDSGAAVPVDTPCTSASANADDANEPPMVFVVFVRPVAMAVSPMGAAAAAAAGRAATRAPAPRPATTMHASTSATFACRKTSPR